MVWTDRENKISFCHLITWSQVGKAKNIVPPPPSWAMQGVGGNSTGPGT